MLTNALLEAQENCPLVTAQTQVNSKYCRYCEIIQLSSCEKLNDIEVDIITFKVFESVKNGIEVLGVT